MSFFDNLDIHTDASLMQELLRMPKIDLHRHLTGSIDAETAIKIAAKYDIKLPSYVSSELQEILYNQRGGNNLEEYFTPWLNILSKLFVSKEAIYDLVVEVIRKASQDNIIYLELRMSPRGFLGKNSFTFEEFLETVSRATAAADAMYGTVTRCILGIPRHVFRRIPSQVRDRMFAKIVSIVSAFHPQCFVGVDLNGDEATAGGEEFKTFFRIARDKGFHITIHAGESGPASNVEYAVNNLHASRIGHGIAAASDPGLLSILAERNCALEICPTSNKILGLVSRTADLPIRKLREFEVPFVICSDNPARCKISLSEELFKAAEAFTLSGSDIKKITHASLKHSFADTETKKMLISRLDGPTEYTQKVI